MRPNRVLLLLVLALVACTHNQRTETIRASVIAVDAAGTAFFEWSTQHQLAMVDAMKAAKLTRDEASKQITEFRAGKDKVSLAIHTALKLLALAATDTKDAADAALKAGADVLLEISTFRKSHEGSP